uniref:Lipase maturation factor n=1 Tax=Petromyzon marinus TaxID=7757 RepID=S4RSS2_PETMA
VVAFSVALHQNRALIGDNGLLPASLYLRRMLRYVGGGPVGLQAVARAPTLLWLALDEVSSLDWALDAVACAGLALAAFVALTGRANMIVMAALWMLYHSLVAVGQIWYSFGWESQLLETGFLAIFLCPLLSLKQYPRGSPPSRIVIWAFLWLIFRIMLGAGLIKIRGDKCWRDLTCMDYHYETQPVPNPVAYYMHREPAWFHRAETLANHFIELVVPFFLLLGRRFRIAHGLLQILFQVVLIISGNLSFLNWLTIIPSLACFDDASLSFLLSRSKREKLMALQARLISAVVNPLLICGGGPIGILNANRRLHVLNTRGLYAFPLCSDVLETLLVGLTWLQAVQNKYVDHSITAAPGLIHLELCVHSVIRALVRSCVHVLLALLIAYLSVPVVHNLMSSTQRMNSSFDPLRIVNTYGAFGSITKERTEVVLQGTASVDPADATTEWEEYDFVCKPGDTRRRPCLVSPYHYRLDWLMWFAAFQTYEQNPWLLHLVGKLLTNDNQTLSLMGKNPFEGRDPPRWIRAQHFRYQFSEPGSARASAGHWWQRKLLDRYLPPVNL